MKGHSTTHALIEIADKLKNAIDDKLLTSGIFIDLTNAFKDGRTDTAREDASITWR